jgi:hypothetical protein
MSATKQRQEDSNELLQTYKPVNILFEDSQITWEGVASDEHATSFTASIYSIESDDASKHHGYDR